MNKFFEITSVRVDGLLYDLLCNLMDDEGPACEKLVNEYDQSIKKELKQFGDAGTFGSAEEVREEDFKVVLHVLNEIYEDKSTPQPIKDAVKEKYSDILFRPNSRFVAYYLEKLRFYVHDKNYLPYIDFILTGVKSEGLDKKSDTEIRKNIYGHFRDKTNTIYCQEGLSEVHLSLRFSSLDLNWENAGNTIRYPEDVDVNALVKKSNLNKVAVNLYCITGQVTDTNAGILKNLNDKTLQDLASIEDFEDICLSLYEITDDQKCLSLNSADRIAQSMKSFFKEKYSIEVSQQLSEEKSVVGMSLVVAEKNGIGLDKVDLERIGVSAQELLRERLLI